MPPKWHNTAFFIFINNNIANFILNFQSFFNKYKIFGSQVYLPRADFEGKGSIILTAYLSRPALINEKIPVKIR